MTTLKEVFKTRPGRLSGMELGHARNMPEMKSMEDELTQRGKHKRWPGFLAQEAGRWPELLDIDVGSIIAAAWNKHGELRKYADRSRYKPGETVKLSLVDHSIRSKHEPHIDFLIGDIKQCELRFDVDVTLSIKGLELRIRDGRIRSILVGSCQAGGEVALHGYRLAKERSRPIEIGPEIDLGDGIAIV